MEHRWHAHSRQSCGGGRTQKKGFDDHEPADHALGRSCGGFGTKLNVGHGPCIRVRFGKAACRACSVRAHCTAAKDEPRQRTLRQQQHHALYDARARDQTAVFKHQYALRAGVESTMAQGALRFGIRRSRYRGLTRTHLQHIFSAIAMNLTRIVAWLWDEPLDTARRAAGPFATLSPYRLSRRTVVS